jgi:Sortase and related acyltransferases
VIIRHATRDDVPQMLEIYNEIILNTTAVYSYQPHTLQMRYDWFDDRVKNNFPVYVAEENGVITGFSTYGYFRSYPAYKYTVENTVHVAKNHRGKGIAKLLLKAIIDDAKEKSFHAMIAVIDADNEVSIKLHEAFGFVETGLLKQVGYKFGRWLDLKFLQLTFNVPANPTEE